MLASTLEVRLNRLVFAQDVMVIVQRQPLRLQLQSQSKRGFVAGSDDATHLMDLVADEMGEHIDRHLKCSNCGAHETVLKRHSKGEA